VLGIDYGARRIGLALSDSSATLASPWRLIERPSTEAETTSLLVHEIEQLSKDEDGLAAVVVGWPRRLDGSATSLTREVEMLAKTLGQRVHVPVVLQDERLTSHEAETRLAARERDWRRRKKTLDSAAAAVMLQDYLDHRRP
jgi:putative Holliday junction resolvase